MLPTKQLTIVLLMIAGEMKSIANFFDYDVPSSSI
jgi:hypothetical protein